MASLTCPNCGKDNPDFLDDCQFCQTPLRREATLNTGEGPTKKSTGELEGVLPDWLKEARQQARDLAEEEAAKEATRPKIQKEEPLDLLAGLAFQAASNEEEVPDWLSAINPVQDKKIPASSKPVENDQPSDFFAQFEGSKNDNVDLSPTIPLPGDMDQNEALPWMSGSTGGSQKEELTDWFSQTSAQSNEPFAFDSGETQIGGRDNFNAPITQEPAPPEQPEDLSWLRDLEASTKQPPPAPATPQADTEWMSKLDSSSGTKEDLSWLNNLGGMPAPSSQPESQPEDLSWLNNLGGTSLPAEPTVSPAQPVSSSEDDLSWLNNLGGTPLAQEPSTSQPASSEEDLSWLNNLGGTPAAAEPAKEEDLSWLNNLGGTPIEPASTQSMPTSDDLGWLNNLGGTPLPSEPAPAQEDLGWLNNLSGTPAAESPSPQPASSADDMNWLNNLGETPAPTLSEPSFSQEELSRLNNLSGTPATPSNEPEPFAQPEVPDWLKDMEAQQSIESAHPPQFSPRNTAPLSADAKQEMPDWLKSATEASTSASMPPLGAAASDWFTAREQPAEKHRFDEISSQPSGLQTSDQTQGSSPALAPGASVASAQDVPVADTRQGAPVEQSDFSTPTDSALANQDVDALFAVDMPDWLSQPEAAADETTPLQEGVVASGPVDELALVDLPSWVQAMRPMEAVISEASAISADQTTEKEGPLAGLRGVIPFAPIGSAQRPKPISLKLQATAEQQAGASLVEQIIASEASAHPLKISPLVSSQRALRWGLTALFVLALSAVIGLGSHFMPISAVLPTEVSNAANVVATMPEEVPVLVVIDYEPSLAGEMEATAGPLLDHMALSRRPKFTFVSTSPNGSALAERLMTNTKINQPAPDGLGYQLDAQYFLAGYLPGGAAGVRSFTEQPKVALPAVNVNLFSDFAAVVVITDQAESGQVWIEQISLAKQSNPALADKSLLIVASAQAGPVLQPYTLSNQVTGMISGIVNAGRYEAVNGGRPGIVRSYWDPFATGLFLAIVSIVIGSLWSLFAGIRARRAEAEPG